MPYKVFPSTVPPYRLEPVVRVSFRPWVSLAQPTGINFNIIGIIYITNHFFFKEEYGVR